jgi:hypothetical protein
MARKLESYSIQELVIAFANKWKLDILDSKTAIKKYPCIVNDKPGEYYIWFKGAVNPFTIEKATKKVLIRPDENLGKYQINQLIEASKGTYTHPVNTEYGSRK